MSSSKHFPHFYIENRKEFKKEKPRKGIGGKTRLGKYRRIERSVMSQMILEGYDYYKRHKFNHNIPVVEKFVLGGESLAKSLRYEFIKNADIKLVGSVDKYSFLFEILCESDLRRICSLIKNSHNKSFLASLSHIVALGGFYPGDKKLLSDSFFKKIKETGEKVKIWIRCIELENAHEKVAEFVRDYFSASNVEIKKLPGNRNIVQAEFIDIKEKSDKIFAHSLVREIVSPTEIYLFEQYIRHQDLEADCIMTRNTGEIYPKAAVVDSGVADNSFLKPWEICTESFVEKDKRSNIHGTFVTGRLLKENDSFGGLEYLNVEFLPDAKKGCKTIDELADTLDLLLKKYAEDIKVWNISLATQEICGERFSDFAYILDILQQKYDVLFVIPTGNYDALRGWDIFELQESDRIVQPAESVNSLVVGSITHKETKAHIKDFPSLFTRRGFAPAGVVKPDIVSYGGSHDMNFGRFTMEGVYSIGINNEVAEDAGTSHACPRVAATAARVYEQMKDEGINITTTRALMIHFSRKGILKESEIRIRYMGWGINPDMETILRNKHDSVTLIHQGDTNVKDIVEIRDIPVPDSLFSGGRLCGEIIMTLVYRPPVDINYPDYYICVNLEASLGYEEKGYWKSLVSGVDICGHKRSKSKEDEQLDKVGFRWNPVKKYTKSFKKKEAPEKLILRVNSSKKDFYKYDKRIPFSLILTFRKDGEDVYKDMDDAVKGVSYISKI